MTPEHNKLNIGCGFRKLNDHWNIDISPICNPDQVLDIEQFPWPYEDNFFTHIHADNVLEHVGQDPKVFTRVIQEMYRVSADQAEWFICVPHHRCDLMWDDYTHVRVLTSKTFKMFDQNNNVLTIEKNLGESTFGLYHGVDLEVYDETYDIIPYWREQQEIGLLGPAQLNINMNTMSNVAELVKIFIRVHKPGRQVDFLAKNTKSTKK
jgi:hypothetical protein